MTSKLTDAEHATIMDACQSISRSADALKDCHTVDGDWGDDVDAKAFYDAELRLLGRLTNLLAPTQQPSGEVTDVQWWLAELDQYGNPKLSDGAHSERAGADKAMYLIKNLGLDTKGKRWAVARVELSEPRPSANGVNMEAVATCRSMVDATRAQGGES
ncbi:MULTISPECIES: hypothetical protein [Burkholderia]|uniref:hypothetical protein n=1 Tax=Burkholderia TaxID=32008 RepID=UPI0003FC20F2|nr:MULTISPECIES: hypothetical protein [Burkholderia]